VRVFLCGTSIGGVFSRGFCSLGILALFFPRIVGCAFFVSGVVFHGRLRILLGFLVGI